MVINLDALIHQDTTSGNISDEALLEENRLLREQSQLLRGIRAIPNAYISSTDKHVLQTLVEEPGINKIQRLINYEKLSKQVGMSKQTLGDSLERLHSVGLITMQQRSRTGKHGGFATDVLVKINETSYTPQTFSTKKKRNHGGKRHICSHCGSAKLKFETRIIVHNRATCMNCGAHNEYSYEVDAKADPTQALLKEMIVSRENGISLCNESDGRFASAEKETDYPVSQTEVPSIEPEHVNDLSDEGEEEISVDQIDSLRNEEQAPVSQSINLTPNINPIAAPYGSERGIIAHDTPSTEGIALLEAIAGTKSDMIVMNPTGKSKYRSTNRVFDKKAARQHFSGKSTKGASLYYPDGTTRAIVYDADTEDSWVILLSSALLLQTGGYKVLLSPSPAGRGGHLWIIFAEPVNIEAAFHHVLSLAPQLNIIKERWPNNNGQRVRLPGGKYVRNGIDAWCCLLDANGMQLSHDGISASYVIVEYQTPASIVPPYTPELVLEPKKVRELSRLIPAHVDGYHKKKYGTKSKFRFEFTEKQLAAYANYMIESTSLDGIEIGRNGYAFADWRGEMTPSVYLYSETNTWCDFGAGGYRENDKRDGGDVIELLCRVENVSRPEAMRKLGKRFDKEASEAVKNAARQGQPVPEWIMRYSTITELGWQFYFNECRRNKHTPQVETPTTVGLTEDYLENEYAKVFLATLSRKGQAHSAGIVA